MEFFCQSTPENDINERGVEKSFGKTSWFCVISCVYEISLATKYEFLASVGQNMFCFTASSVIIVYCEFMEEMPKYFSDTPSPEGIL